MTLTGAANVHQFPKMLDFTQEHWIQILQHNAMTVCACTIHLASGPIRSLCGIEEDINPILIIS
jgi:hypothetical protein